MKRLTLTICAVVMGVVASAWAVPVLDQESPYLGNSTFNVSDDIFNWQQEVTVGIAGQLVQIELYVTDPGAAIIYINAGAPWQSDAPDFTTTFAPSSSGWVTIDTSSAGLIFDVDDHFVIGVQGVDNGGLWLGGSYAAPDGSYDRGLLWVDYGNGPDIHNQTLDFAFRTYVPEPATVALLGLGTLSLLRKRSA